LTTRRIILTSLATLVAIVILAVVAIVLSDEREAEFGPKPTPVYSSQDTQFAYTAATKLQESNYLAELALMNTNNIEVLELAREARVAQTGQLAVIEAWLTETRQPEIFDFDPEFGIAQVLTSVELRQLEAARGSDFDALLLNALYEHNLVLIDLAVGYLADAEDAEDATDALAFQVLAREILDATQARQERVRALR
jgi:uncharacterized protein (DUF305 family)